MDKENSMGKKGKATVYKRVRYILAVEQVWVGDN